MLDLDETLRKEAMPSSVTLAVFYQVAKLEACAYDNDLRCIRECLRQFKPGGLLVAL